MQYSAFTTSLMHHIAFKDDVMSTTPQVDYQTSPEQYKHWTLSCDGPVATLTMNVNEDGGLREGYKLKLNSYDLGVDIELNDAVQDGGDHQRQGPHLLFRRQHLHAGQVQPCVEGQLLQVHQ